MGLREWIGKRFKVSQSPPGWITERFGAETASGVHVNEETALEYLAVFACVRVLAESVAGV
jgi:phage portal protein BeeE